MGSISSLLRAGTATPWTPPPPPSTGTLWTGAYLDGTGATVAGATKLRARYERFGLWRGRPVNLIRAFNDPASWSGLTDGFGPNAGTLPAMRAAVPEGGRLMLATFGLPNYTGTTNALTTLREGATGAYDTRWANLITRLKSVGFTADELLICHMYEHSGNWFRHGVDGNKDGGNPSYGTGTLAEKQQGAVDYANYFATSALAMKNVDADVQIGWGGNVGAQTFVDYSYPADDSMIDAHIYDIYDAYWKYPQGMPTASSTTVATARANTATAIFDTDARSMTYLRTFARTRGKAFGLGEWSTTEYTFGSGGVGGGDNPAFVDRMADFRDETLAMGMDYYDCKFDTKAGDGDFRYYADGLATYTKLPASAIRYQQRQALPGAELDLFAHGYTEPTTANTGTGVMVAVREGSRQGRPPVTILTENLVMADGQIVSDKIINGHISCASTLPNDAWLINCEVRGPAVPGTTSQKPLVQGPMHSLGRSSGVLFVQGCEVYAQTPSPYIWGVGPRNVWLERTYVHHTIDALGAFVGSTAAADGFLYANYRAFGNLLDWSVKFAPDPANLESGAPRAETHNDMDGIQGNNPGGATSAARVLDIWRVGNKMFARYDPAYAPTSPSGNRLTISVAQAITGQAVWAAYHRNWLLGGDQQGISWGGTGTYDAASGVEVIDNIFGNDGTAEDAVTYPLVVRSFGYRVVTGNLTRSGAVVPIRTS